MCVVVYVLLTVPALGGHWSRSRSHTVNLYNRAGKAELTGAFWVVVVTCLLLLLLLLPSVSVCVPPSFSYPTTLVSLHLLHFFFLLFKTLGFSFILLLFIPFSLFLSVEQFFSSSHTADSRPFASFVRMLKYIRWNEKEEEA